MTRPYAVCSNPDCPKLKEPPYISYAYSDVKEPFARCNGCDWAFNHEHKRGSMASSPALTSEDIAALFRAAAVEVVVGAVRQNKNLQNLGQRCYERYGRGAFSVHFASAADARDGKAILLDEWLKALLRKSAAYPLDETCNVPEKILEAARSFSCDCAADGQLGTRVIYRRAERLLEQMPLEGAGESREALSSYDPLTELCVCGEVPAGPADEVFTVVARMPVDLMVKKQTEQQKKWLSIREHVLSLKSLGNAEMQDKDVGAELAAKSYQEALRLLLETTMEDYDLEITLRLNLAEALARCSRWSDSAAECKAVLLLSPSNVKALYRHGRALLRMDCSDEACVELLKAALISPSDRMVREELERARNWVPTPVVSETKPTTSLVSKWRLEALHFWRQFCCSKLSPTRIQSIIFLVTLMLAAIRLRRLKRT